MQPIVLRNPETGIEKKFEVPTEFNELTQNQYLGAVAILNNLHDRPELQWAMVPLITRIPMNDLMELNEVHRVQLLAELEFVFTQQNLPYKSMITSFSTWQYRNIHCPRKIARAFSTTLYGPGDVLGNLNFGEFMAAEARLELFKKNPAANHNALNELCGILYRKSDGSRKKYIDKRIHFEAGMIPTYGKVFEVVSKDVKSAILMNYQGAKAMFPKLYGKLFPPPPEEIEGKAPTEQKQGSQSLTWLNMMIGMADRDVTKFNAIKSATLHETLKTLDDMIDHNQKMKVEAEKRSRK